MNRGQASDLVFLNVPDTIVGSLRPTPDVYARPSVATMAPLFTPQVPIVPMQPQMPPIVMPPQVSYATLAPHSAPANATYVVSIVTLAIILVLWIAKLLFKRK